MSRRAFLGVAVAFAAATGLAHAADLQNTAQIERGRYLVIVGDCAACHTAPGGQPFAGGRPLETPFGKLISPNLTPDQETGIGAWTDDAFYRAMHEGIGPGNTHLYPGFPYTAYTRVTRADVDAIRAWLATLPAVRNPVVSNQLPFPFDVRASLAAWNALYFKPGEFQPDAAKSAAWNRGAYLVQGLGHCGTCHTPKTALGGEEASRFLQGESLQGWFAPALTNDGRSGIGGWTEAEIVAYLRDGANAHALSSGPMGEVVAISTSQMTDDDLRAIATYLKDQPAVGAAATPVASTDAAMQRGAQIYVDQCSACHTPNGSGVPHLFPQLAGSPAVQQRGTDSLVRVVLQGARAVATDGAPTAPAMPGFAWKLSDSEIADVITYIRNAWGNAAPASDPNDVTAARARLGLRAD